MRTIQILGCVVGLAGVLSVVGCEEPAPVAENPVRPIKIHRIGSLQPNALREFPGTIRAYQTAEMGFEVPGRIIEFLVREGDTVQRGAVLAKLDPADYTAELKVAQANLEKAKADLTRSENIRREDPGAISEDDLERDRRSVKVTEAELEIAQKAVNDTQLVAPFGGLMARKLVEDYANVQAKEPVLILQDNSILEIEVSVPERELVKRSDLSETKEEISKRLKTKIVISALKEKEFSGWIREFATVADPVTRTFPVKLNFENPKEYNILPGMTARVRLVVDPDSAWSVPVSAVQANEDGQSYVWRVDADSMTVASAPVEMGVLSGDRVMLKDGVKEGDQVAISGVTALREGMQVREYEN